MLTGELRLRCTEAMLLSLDRELRVAYVLGDILQLSSADAAAALEIDGATYRKRLSRARERLYAFMRGWCGVLDPANPCRCARQIDCAAERGLIAPDDLYLSKQRTRVGFDRLRRAADEVAGLMQVAEVMRGPALYAAPEARARSLLDTMTLELLRP